jgi:hypothetical protein
MITPSGTKVTVAKRRRKTSLIVDTLFRDSARKPLGPIYIHLRNQSFTHLSIVVFVVVIGGFILD